MTVHGLGPVAVLGTGTIGASWAALFLANGLDVMLWDPSDNARARFESTVDDQIAMACELVVTDGAPGRWSFTRSPGEAVSGCWFVQENGPEDLRAKRILYAQFAENLPPTAVVASSTSSLMPTQLQAGLAFSERFLIGHPFNPPHLIPLIEVVGGETTSERAIDIAMATYLSLGKHPIRLFSERPGHLANRLQAALWREAVDAVTSGSASVADVDAAVTHALGPRWAIMGPHATFHLAGGSGGLRHFMEHLGPTFVALWKDLRQPELNQAAIESLVSGLPHTVAGSPSIEVSRERDVRLLALLTTVRPI